VAYQLSLQGNAGASTWLGELIWRDFYSQILFNYPHVTTKSFKPAYDAIKWEQGAAAKQLFKAWCDGQTGYPIVDAAMMQIRQTGYMHNRLRMIAASFLVKDLGIDWRWCERYFAEHLNDFDLASNNGGWQWACSSGCDAQPYFRIFSILSLKAKSLTLMVNSFADIASISKLNKNHSPALACQTNGVAGCANSLGSRLPKADCGTCTCQRENTDTVCGCEIRLVLHITPSNSHPLQLSTCHKIVIFLGYARF
jgi:hypothetical protein